MKRAKSISFIIAILLAFCILASACQATPEETFVAQKTGDLEEKIQATATPGPPTGVGSHYYLERTYESSGKTLIVDADITGGDESKMAVLTVEEKLFESGDSLKKIMVGLFPGYEAYDYEFTKSDWMEQIRDCELQIFRARNGLDPNTGEPAVSGEDYMGPIPSSLDIRTDFTTIPAEELLRMWADECEQGYLEELKKNYEEAPEDDELGPPDFKISSEESYLPQENILLKKGDLEYCLDFVNPAPDETGVMLWVDRHTNYHEIGRELAETLPERPTPASQMKNSEEFEKVKGLLADMGADYLELYEFYPTDNACEYIFTRAYHGAVEDYAGEYLNLKPTDGDGVVVQNLWKPEYLSIVMYEGEIYTIRWKNISRLVKVDNESVKILPWEEIQEIFERQIGYMMTPDEESHEMFWWRPSNVKIERITLGLGKVLMKDTNEYKLIPVWNFFGRDDTYTSLEEASEKCYLSINALDGTIVDRNAMY